MNTGLLKTPVDKRDLKHNKYFGGFNINQLPANFYDEEYPKIKNQKDTDFCTGFASAAVSEEQEGVELSPEFIYAMGKKISGDGISEWGADLRTICKVHTKIGAIEQKEAKYTVETQTRNFLANPMSWKDVEDFAVKHQKKTYLRIDTGVYDTFDNVRVALWLHKDDVDKKAVFCGIDWFPEMTVQGGVMPNRRMGVDIGDGQPQGHAIKIRPKGWKTINGQLYLIIQNSWGEEYGDKGLFYIPRTLFNQVNAFYGAFMFVDMTPDDVKQMTSLYQQALNILQQIFWLMKNKVGTFLRL